MYCFYRLRQSWVSALSAAEVQFRSLLVSPNSSGWKKVPPQAVSNGLPNSPTSKNGALKGKSRVSWSPENMVMHRKQMKDGDVIRVVLDIPSDSPVADLDKWRAVLATPDVRPEWDPSVENSNLVEMFDWNTRITRTSYTLGWPAK